jgi:acetyl esterase/lipase
LALLPLIFVLVLLAVVIWIIVPPRNRTLWLVSIGVGEWSLWFGALALVCAAWSLADHFITGASWIWIGTLTAGAAVIAISLYPLFSVLPLGRQNKVRFSLRRYFSNIPAYDFFTGRNGGYKERNFQTRIFSTINGNELALDAYLPTVKNENNGASVIVVHGGSWNGGARNDFPRWNAWLAAHGFTVFDIDYRLSPQPNYLTAPEDVKTAVRWVKSHAGEFGIDPGRVALMGRSAGAHLALLAAYTAHTLDEADRVRAVVSFYGPVDLLWAYGIPSNKKVHDGPGSLINLTGGRPDDSDEIRERYISASPVSHVDQKTPPTFMIHGGSDRLVWWKNMYRLGEKLKAANVPHEIYLIPHGQHGFDYNINGWASQAAGSLVLRFLAANTKPS